MTEVTIAILDKEVQTKRRPCDIHQSKIRGLGLDAPTNNKNNKQYK